MPPATMNWAMSDESVADAAYEPSGESAGEMEMGGMAGRDALRASHDAGHRGARRMLSGVVRFGVPDGGSSDEDGKELGGPALPGASGPALPGASGPALPGASGPALPGS